MMRPKWNKDYIKLFIDFAHNIPFSIDGVNLRTTAGKREAYRYLMVCGHIPVTAENVALGPETFYLDHLKDLKGVNGDVLKAAQETIEKAAQQNESEWEVDEECDEEVQETKTSYVEGVWIQRGKIVSAKICRRELVEVTKMYVTPEKLNLSFGEKVLEVVSA